MTEWGELREVYDDRARDLIHGEGGRGVFSRKQNEIRRELAALPSGRVAEFGCGTGPYIASLAAEGRHELVIAADISPVILTGARRRVVCGNEGSSTAFVACNLEMLPFRPGTFDGVLCTQVIEHLLDERQGLREIHRVLKPGGTLVISTDNVRNYPSKVMEFPVLAFKKLMRMGKTRWDYPHRDFAPNEFLGLVRSEGFLVLKHRTFRFSLPTPLQRFEWLERLIARVEKPFERLLWWRGWGDIILVVAQKEEPCRDPVSNRS